MKVVLPRAELLRVLNVVGRALPGRTVLPILNNFVIAASGNRFSVGASNLDAWLSGGVDVEGGPADQITACIPAQSFRNFVDKAGYPDIILSFEGDWVILKSGRATVKLPTSDVDDFPNRPTTNEVVVGEVNGADIARLVQAVAFAAGNEGGRPVLDTVYWNADGEKMSMVGFNGHRLAYADLPALNTKFGPILLNQKLITMIPRIWDRDVVTLTLGQAHIKIQGGGFLGAFREGSTESYPNFAKFLELARGDMAFTVPSDRFTSAVGRIGVVAEELTTRVLMEFSPVSLKLSMNSPDRGSVDEELDQVAGPGHYSEGVSYRYLNEVAGTLGTGVTRITVGQGKPFVIEPFPESNSVDPLTRIMLVAVKREV